MIIRMIQNMSGGRYDNQQWPPAGIDFEVPDEEGEALIRDRNALFVRHSAVAPEPVVIVEQIVSEPSPTGSGPIWSSAATGPAWSTPGDEKADKPAAKPALEKAAPEPTPDEIAHEAAPLAQTPNRPKPSESKRLWEDYAVAKGMDPDDAVDSTKAELMSKFGGRL